MQGKDIPPLIIAVWIAMRMASTMWNRPSISYSSLSILRPPQGFAKFLIPFTHCVLFFPI